MMNPNFNRLPRSLILACCIAAASAAAAGAEWKAFSDPAGQQPAPLVLPDLNGRDVDLSALRGEVVVVNFWATWCEPCRDEMPSLNRLHRQLGGKRLHVIGVNVGEGQARIEQFLDRIPVDFAILRDADRDVSKSWRVRVMPATFLVDSRGMLRYQLLGDADWDDPKIRAPILQLMKESRPWSSSSSVQQRTLAPSAPN